MHKRTWQKNLRAFVHSLDKDDIAFEDIDENFGEEYKLFLKRDQGRIDTIAGSPADGWRRYKAPVHREPSNGRRAVCSLCVMKFIQDKLGEDMHLEKTDLLQEGAALLKVFHRLTGEAADAVGGTLPHCIAVPSAQVSLTSLFGMGRGGTSPQ